VKVVSKQQKQYIIDIYNMSFILNIRQLETIKELQEKMIDAHLLSLAPDALLENMDVTEKLMLIRELSKDEETIKREEEEAVSFEEVLKKAGLTIEDLQD